MRPAPAPRSRECRFARNAAAAWRLDKPMLLVQSSNVRGSSLAPVSRGRAAWLHRRLTASRGTGYRQRVGATTRAAFFASALFLIEVAPVDAAPLAGARYYGAV